LADEVEQKEESLEVISSDQDPPEVEGLEARIVELEGLVTQKDDELAKAVTRLLEFEQLVAGKDEDINGLKQSRDELEERLTSSSNSLVEAVGSYKAALLKANPEVIEELITGDTIEAINESLNKAKTLVSRVRLGVEAEISQAKVPAGAPERTSPDLSALSPREKIQYAIGGNK